MVGVWMALYVSGSQFAWRKRIFDSFFGIRSTLGTALPNSHSSAGTTPDRGCGANFRRSAGSGNAGVGVAPETAPNWGSGVGVAAPSAAGAWRLSENRLAPRLYGVLNYEMSFWGRPNTTYVLKWSCGAYAAIRTIKRRPCPHQWTDCRGPI